MSRIHSMMDVGRRSMSNSQNALQTTGHNIANRSTEGYSRQRVDIEAAEPVGIGRNRIGNGSRTTGVSRINNPYLERQIAGEQSQLGYYNGKADALVRVEQVFNEQITKGLNTSMGEFFNAWREFSNNPETMATRRLVTETSDSLGSNFTRIHNQLTDIQKDVDQQLKVQVTDINGFTREIASLNERIMQVESAGGQANDERDRRDLLIKQLGEKVDIRWAEGMDGSVTITAGSAALLVAGNDAKELSVASTPATATKDEGCFDIMYKSSKEATAVKMTNQFKGGAVGGLLEIRDGHIRDLKGNIDTMAFSLATGVNTAHRMGFDSMNQPGEDFFKQPQQVEGAALKLRVADAIKKDPSKLASAAQPDAPGDNRIAQLVANLQYQKIVGGSEANRQVAAATGSIMDGSSTLDDFYNSIVGQVGVLTRRNNSAVDSQKDVLKQLTNIRESVSGVNLDEEATKMIEYQKSFDASARLIRTADEMFDTILNLKR